MPAVPTDTIGEWESKVLPNAKVKPPITANHNLSSKLVSMSNSKIRVIFKGSYLKLDKVPFTQGNVVHLFIFYELTTWSRLD